MEATKIIYGKGRAPRPSEFSGDQLVINADDAKVYSKDKTNNVFEVGGSGTSFSAINFTGKNRSIQVRPSDNDNDQLTLIAGTGIDFEQENIYDKSKIRIVATGESNSTFATASYVKLSNVDFDRTIDITSDTNLGAGSGLQFAGDILNINTGTGLTVISDELQVEDIFLKNNEDDSSTGTITAANIHSNGIVKLAPQGDIAPVAGGIYYSNNNNFYLGFS